MLAKEVIQRVREIQIRTGRHVADVLAGQYSAVFKGRGIEFDEVRPYVPGDEVRTIDWNVTARMGSPFVKRYIEERQLTLMLMADISSSQDFGSQLRSKREVAAELCALLAFSATFNDDKVGLTLFHGEIEQYIPARKGQKHALRVVREVLSHESRLSLRTPQRNRVASWLTGRASQGSASCRSTNIRGAVEFLLSVNKRKTVCFVVSDFFDQAYIKTLQMASRKHDVIAVLINDPRETEIPNVGIIQLQDAESGETLELDTSSRSVRSFFKQSASQRVDHLRQEFRRAKIDFISIDTSESVVDPLARFFRMRERRRRR